MPELSCTVRRIGDYESRTEEYEVVYYAVARGVARAKIKYQAARAFEINAALDASAQVARRAIADEDPELKGQPKKHWPSLPGARSSRPSTTRASRLLRRWSTESKASDFRTHGASDEVL